MIMLSSIYNLLISTQYIPHGHCYLWQPELLWLHILTDMLIALAYFSIPLTLIFFIRGREDIPFKGIFILFSLFIFSCGTTHLMSIWTLWHPSYWVSGLIKAITAIVSLMTAFEMVPTLPKALALRSPKELETVNQSLQVEITNRQQAEIALQKLNAELESIVEQRTQEYKESEQRFRTLFEAAPDFIYLLNLEGVIEQINPIVMQRSGYTESELINRPLVDFFPSNFQQLYEQKFSELLLRRGNRQEVEFICKDEQVLTMDCSCSVVGNIDEQDTYILVLQRDISDRKRMESTLKESEERLQLALEASKQGLWDWDIVTGDVFLSPRWQEMLDYNSDELTVSINTWEELIHPDDRPWVMEKLNNHLKNSSISYDFDYRLRGKEGDWKWISNYGKVVDYGQSGKPTRMVGLHKDISDRKRNEETLKQINQELLVSNQELEKFAYLASHDLREPLRMVTSFTQLLAQRYSGKLDAEADQIISFAVDGASRMEELIHDLLEYSCVGKAEKSLVLVDLEAVLDRALNNLQVSIKESNVEITHTNLPIVVGAQGELIQLWQNLIDNAILYRQQVPLIIEIDIEEQQDFWLFSVKDNGIGIAPTYRKRIFQIFQRLHTKQEYPGTGIGLAICHKIVERHGGKIWVESELGMGATFYFTLPVVKDI